MKTIKRIISILAVISVLAVSAFAFSVPVFAAASVSMTPSGGTVDYTKNITVKIGISATEAILNTEGTVTFDASRLQYLGAGGDYANSTASGRITIFDDKFGENEKTASYTLTFKALTTGDMTVSYSGFYTNWDAVPTNMSGTSSFTATDPSLTDASLTSLSVSTGSLSPRFSAGTTNYSVSVGNTVEQITINAAAVAGASLTGGGTVSLDVGDNSHSVTVTAKDGSTKKNYTINIHRRTVEEDEALNAEPDETPDVDVLQVQVSGESHHILSELPETAVPNGFEQTTADYNGVQVPVYASKGNEYVLYSLKRDEDENIDYYTYDSIRDEFVLLPYMKMGERMFIFAVISENLTAPAGYTASTANLGNSSVKVFCSDKVSLADFCIVYCFVDGDYKFYSYDLLENTIQRAPDFELLSISDDIISDETEKPANWIEAFRRMPAAGKTVIFALLIAVLCIIALVVLLIIRAVNAREFAGDGIAFEPDDEFDSIDEIDSHSFRFETIPIEQSPTDAAEESESPETVSANHEE